MPTATDKLFDLILQEQKATTQTEIDIIHLKCLRCGKTYYHTEFAMSEMSYRMYSYCPDCIDKGIEALKGISPVKPRMDFDGQDVWRCGNCGRTLFHPTHTECDQDAKNIVRFCNRCGKKVDWNG